MGRGESINSTSALCSPRRCLQCSTQWSITKEEEEEKGDKERKPFYIVYRTLAAHAVEKRLLSLNGSKSSYFSIYST